MDYYNKGNDYGSGYGASNPYDNSNPYNSRPSNPYDRQQGNPYDRQQGHSNPYDTGHQYNAGPPAYTSPVEMQPLGGQAPYDQQPQAPREDPNALLNEVRQVSRAADDLESRLGELQRLQRGFVAGQGQSNKEIDALSADIMTGYRGLTDRVRRIKGQREAGSQRNRPQIESLDRKVRNAINAFQKLESAFRKEVSESQRRQYLIVNPTATQSEIEEATSGSDVQIFQQALLNSDRRGQAQSTLRNVRERHDAIQQIERTMMELNQLFQDLDRMVIEQEPMIENIETKTAAVHEDLEQGNNQMVKAVSSARAARKKKWICLAICVAIILIIVLIIIIYMATTGKFSGSSKQ
ncbi:hypothetical protein AMS68_003249 [Peltaster fructicola]|uniref:t-SNARE coiled-coil homology domain-containing protein n=1 Tax=Peltaster fructicola TaxID=286661 RepID=A0A6H0XSI7_9PEZI|nr:hypothetical protein AMS68_003249 [Peltaster fructicola]